MWLYMFELTLVDWTRWGKDGSVVFGAWSWGMDQIVHTCHVVSGGARCGAKIRLTPVNYCEASIARQLTSYIPLLIDHIMSVSWYRCISML